MCPSPPFPTCVIKSFISAEDKNFYQHGGLDIQGIIRAVVTNMSNVQSGRRAVGASTITQQVAKNFLLSSDQTVERKLKEAILAIRIERAFTKEQILELYLNEIYLGAGAYGVAAAAQILLGQGAERTHACRLRLSRDAAQGAEQLRSVQISRSGRRAPQLGHRPHRRERLRHQGRGRDGQGPAARRHQAQDRTQDLRLGIFRRGGAPRDSRPLRRGQALWRRPVGAHHARPTAATASPARPWSMAWSPTITGMAAGADR